jgi:uncharacterized protein (DUF1501 family)
MSQFNRRQFLAGAGAATFMGGAGALSSLVSSQAYAADPSGYKALVCVFLFGGMDHGDTVLPYDMESYNKLAGLRQGLFSAYGVGSGTSSRDRDNLLALNPVNSTSFGGRQFALPGELAPLHSLFEQGELSIVGGLGPLVAPTTRSAMDANSVVVPERLFSHNDQQSTWMALGVEGARLGWGGRFVDAALQGGAVGDPTFSAISTDSSSVFLFGEATRPFRAAGGDPIGLDAVEKRWLLGGNSRYDEVRQRLLQHFSQGNSTSSNTFERDFLAARAGGVLTGYEYRAARLGAAPLATEFPGGRLGGQLKTVAETISVRSMLAANRQVFFVGMGGFDTHNNQAGDLPGLHNELAGGLSAFRDAMVELGVWDDVTLFTMSDFGRTLNDNGDGTDHGWAGHHFVMGGGVRGQHIYGDIASPDPDSEAYTSSRPRLIPSVSVEQYAASLGGWFGLDQGAIQSTLPNLANFSGADLDLFATA